MTAAISDASMGSGRPRLFHMDSASPTSLRNIFRIALPDSCLSSVVNSGFRIYTDTAHTIVRILALRIITG